MDIRDKYRFTIRKYLEDKRLEYGHSPWGITVSLDDNPIAIVFFTKNISSKTNNSKPKQIEYFFNNNFSLPRIIPPEHLEIFADVFFDEIFSLEMDPLMRMNVKFAGFASLD